MSLDYDIETDGLYLEGIEKGTEQGFDLGRAEVIRKLIIKNPQMSDQEIAEMHDVDLDWVKSIRKSIQQ